MSNYPCTGIELLVFRVHINSSLIFCFPDTERTTFYYIKIEIDIYQKIRLIQQKMEDEICSVCSYYMQCITCNSCKKSVCKYCRLETCDWCDHMRTDCNSCPMCNKLVTICGNNKVCMTWIISGTYNGEISYCSRHDNLVPSEGGYKNCDIEHERSFVKQKMMDLYRDNIV